MKLHVRADESKREGLPIGDVAAGDWTVDKPCHLVHDGLIDPLRSALHLIEVDEAAMPHTLSTLVYGDIVPPVMAIKLNPAHNRPDRDPANKYTAYKNDSAEKVSSQWLLLVIFY